MDRHTTVLESQTIDWDGFCPGESDLHRCVVDDDCQGMMTMLYTGGIDVDVPSDNLMTPLLLAVLYKKLEAVGLLLAWKASPDVSETTHLMTPLMIAASGEKKEDNFILQLLLKSGAKLNAQNKFGRTALVVAVRAQKLDNVEILCKAGADLDIPDEKGHTAVFKALLRDNIKMLKVLKEYGADFDRPARDSGNVPLITAIQTDRLEVVKYLIESKASLEVKNKDGDTALHAAVWEINTDVVYMLCEAGADINTLDKDGKTPLENALVQKNINITMTLLEFDAKGSSGSVEETILRKTSGFEDFQTTIRTFMQIQERRRASQHEHMSRIQAIADEMICSICLEVVTKPTTVIPCYHSFCEKCGQELHKCPTCRSDIKGRHSNFMLTNVSKKCNNDEPPAKRARA